MRGTREGQDRERNKKGGSVHRPKQGTVHLLARHGGKCASVELSCIIA